MAPAIVDQLSADGSVIQAPDVRLSRHEKIRLLQEVLPGSTPVTVAGVSALRFKDDVLLFKQVTYLGVPWEAFKKRIQIPRSWIEAEAQARTAGLHVHFVGIYRYAPVTIFVDFDPTTYVRRKANNSAAHVATNDLYQAWKLGTFSRQDTRGNRLTSIRSSDFANYLTGHGVEEQPAVDVFRQFNRTLLAQGRIPALAAVTEMYQESWKDTFQAEWPGFYLEYRLARFTQTHRQTHWVTFQKNKHRADFDYDLLLHDQDGSPFFGDLKASNSDRKEAPGNDSADLRRYISTHERFWYVVYEHETWRARDNGDTATIAWNHWRQALGAWPSHKEFNPLSYRTRFKEAVAFKSMFILEVNPSNIDVVLGDFHQGQQPSGAARALKVMIKKRNIENFLVYSEGRSTPR